MPYTLNRKANYTIEVIANSDAAAVQAARDDIAKTFRRKAEIPGFRRGKAPLNTVRRRFANEIDNELKEELTSTLWTEFAEAESDIRPITQPRFSDVDFDEDGGFHFTAEMEIRPELELKDVSGIELPSFSLEVTDTEIETELARLQEEQASWEPAEDAVGEDGMLVEADLHGEIEGDESDPYDEENARFVIGDDKVPAEINESLQGAQAGGTATATKVFPEDDSDEKRAGKKVEYTITVHSLKRKVLPEIDDELAANFDLESLDELKERIKEGLSQRKLGERREAWRRHALDFLEEGMDPAELPASLVQATLNQEMQRLAYSLAMQGIDLEEVGIDWKEMAAKQEPTARAKVLDDLVIEQLSEQWDIPVPENEVDAHINSEAQRLSIPPAEHKANLAKEDKLEQLRFAARMAATTDALIERAGGDLSS